ncbi:MAG: hypothetical protein WDA20_08755 [Desulfuromonadales bacterium]|jgi:hypothetical protein
MRGFGRFGFLAVVASVLFLSGCDRDNEVRTTVYDKAESAATEKAPGEPVLLPAQRQEYLQTAQARLARLDDRMTELQEQAARLPETARTEFAAEVEKWRQARMLAEEKLGIMRDAGAEEWQRAQNEVADILAQMERDIAGFYKKLKTT